METLSQHRDKIVIGALVLVILAVSVFVVRRIAAPAPKFRPGQSLEDPLGGGKSGSATTR
jgi:hypothetical protein